ncbi:Na+/H+ antiporter subunit A [Parafrigoribacterium mesophilum]|uniref:Na+/H+ antiporter subunit A n=1 Tax=Parafrigoribacterium mesophilum TaxID=433646 RepID=UPI0031FE2ADE
MLAFLVAFGLVSLVVPAVTRALGVRIFPLVALVPAAAFVLTLTQTPTVSAGHAAVEAVPWIPQLQLDLSVRVDALSWLLALIVTGVGALVILYCTTYFAASEHGLGRFASSLLAFTGGMYGLVIADNVYLLFLFWEATSVFSYLLIGHYTGRLASRGAALQALIVTTAGGLAMLVGLVLLAQAAGTASLTKLLGLAPHGTAVTIAIMLILVGALSKSAIIPFHFWLPAAMAAPTPVSAYLHAAAMVQAGIYLIARLAPGFGDTPGWHPLLLSLGVFTMLVGGWRALTQFDLKLLLAYGTVSQLGFLVVVVSFGTRTAALAGLALLLAHALFKAALFLIVGIVDHRAGTRDLRKLSGLGREAPFVTAIAVLATLSMAGLPLTAGFVAKEAVLTALLEDATSGSTVGWIIVVGVALGSTLTVAYSARFLWGAFARKRDVEKVRPVHESVWFLFSPGLLAVAGIALAPLFGAVGTVLAGYSALFPPAHQDYVLAMWHGVDSALIVSTLTVLGGVAMFLARTPVFAGQSRVPAIVDSSELYRKLMRALDRVAGRVTATTQRGSLPFYLGVILLVMVGSVGTTLALNRTWPDEVLLFDSPAQLAAGAIMAVAAVALVRAGKRFSAALLVGVTGYGMAALFAFHGAPDLALTQVLVETVTLIAFVLVLRRLPARLGQEHGSAHRVVRAVVGAAVGLVMAAVAVVALGARTASPISLALPDLAHEFGHGNNVVNVVLVDIRGWDTLGELSVLIAAATGVASLVFLRSRTDNLPRVPDHRRRRTLRARLRPMRETVAAEYVPGVQDPSTRNAWLLAGRKLAPENRSILLEVVIRLLFHAVVVLSVYILFTGHNLPGGGFAGGLVAGLALAGRYLAGGRYELGAAAPLDAGKLLGAGLILAAGTATAPLLFGEHALTSTWFEATVPVLGHLEFTTSTVFDVGVYLVVIGMVLDVLRSLGAEVDRQQEDASEELESGSTI